jgi:hypothetical protein
MPSIFQTHARRVQVDARLEILDEDHLLTKQVCGRFEPSM